MEAIIKKVKDQWVVQLDSEKDKSTTFNGHDSAVEYAYKKGAEDFVIKYSNNVQRSFNRETVENLVLKVA